MHDRLRASCMLPFHMRVVARLWQVRQVSDASRGFIVANTRIFVLSPDSACSLPGAVTGLARLFAVGRRRPRVLRLAVQRRAQVLAFAVVAGDARVVADVAVRRRRWLRRGRLACRRGRRVADTSTNADRDKKSLHAVGRALGAQPWCQLFDRMARLAVLTDLPAVLRLVVVVVAAETARRIDVTDVVGVGAERHVHLRKHVAAIDVLHAPRPRDRRRLRAARGCGRGKNPAAPREFRSPPRRRVVAFSALTLRGG